MKRWQKLIVFIVALFVFSLFSWGMGKAAAWWVSVQVSVCGNICTKGGDLGGPVFWIQLIGLTGVGLRHHVDRASGRT